jgi:hypothetical protein
MFCNCINLNIDKTFFNNEFFICCENENPYYIEEKNICVKECSDTEYKNLIINNKTCSKECPLIYNSKCYNECPSNTHKNENNSQKKNI